MLVLPARFGGLPYFVRKNDETHLQHSGEGMTAPFFKVLLTTAMLGAVLVPTVSAAAQEFPFGLEMTLDAAPKPGSKRIPNIEIGDRGEARLELWCNGGVGQFSVAGDTVIFVPGAMTQRNCPEDLIAADNALLAQLGAATNWTRQGDIVTLTGSGTLRFHLNTN
jgi:heat shock protein HslJ